METKNIVVKVGGELEKQIADKVAEAVKNSYYGKVGDAINEKIIAKMTEKDYIEKIADSVLKRIQLTEEEYIEKISIEIKSALLSVTATLTSTALKAVEERIKAYGFIQIGR